MKRIILFITAYILWLLLTWSLDWQPLIVGVFVALLVALLFGNIFVAEPLKCLQPQRYFWLLCYIPFFLWECFKANIDVAYRVLSPFMPIHPGIVKVKTTLKTDMAKTALANSITMTPGTLSVDIEDEYLYIHWINVQSPDLKKATEIIVQKFEKKLARIFD